VNKKDTNNNKRISFTYVGKETKFITNLFINTKINISYNTKNTAEKLLAYKQQECINKCNGKGIFALKVPDCGKRHLGQTENPSILDLKNTFSLINIKIKILYL